MPYLVYVSFTDKHDEPYAFVTVHREEDYVKTLFDKATSFWNDHVLQKIPPEKTAKDLIERIDAEWFRCEEQYVLRKQHFDLAEERLEEAKEKLQELSEGKSCIGKMVKLLKYELGGRVDYEEKLKTIQKEIVSRYPESEILFSDIEKFRKPSTYKYRITIQ